MPEIVSSSFDLRSREIEVRHLKHIPQAIKKFFSMTADKTLFVRQI